MFVSSANSSVLTTRAKNKVKNRVQIPMKTPLDFHIYS